MDSILPIILAIVAAVWGYMHLDPRRGGGRRIGWLHRVLSMMAVDVVFGVLLVFQGYLALRSGHMDFALLLVLATAISGLVWALDRWWLARRRAEIQGDDALEPALVDYSRSFFPLLLIVLVLRSFVAEPFRIPSGSMVPTLLDGDFILVNKYTYGVRLPVLETQVLEVGSPERGDVAVFRYPMDNRQRFIKRVVGLPGDRITYQGIQLYVNGEPVPMERLGVYAGPQAPGAVQFLETLGEVEHRVLHRDDPRLRRLQQDEFLVPDGHYYVMGDNRDSSNDSRAWGLVPQEYLVGRAFMIWMNWERLTVPPRWERIGQRIE